jgi:hypothetical protein
MNTQRLETTGIIASVFFTIGIISGCDYCLPFLLMAASITAMMNIARKLDTTQPDELIELLSHSAH